MSENEARLYGVLAELAADERQRLGASVSIDDLLAYRRGELAETDAERVRDLLAADPEWAEIYLDLARTDALEAAAADVSEEEIGREWRALEQRLAPRGRLLPFRRLVAMHPLSAVAASFLLAVVGTWFLRPALEPRPAIGPMAVFELLPEQLEGQLRGRPTPVEIGAGSENVALRLEPPPEAELLHPLPSRCRYEIVRGERVIASGEATVQAHGYALDVPPGALPTGDYEIRLFDPERAGAGPFATYVFELREAP